MSELFSALRVFLFTLSIKLKILKDSEFIELLKQLDPQQKVYAIWLRYFI